MIKSEIERAIDYKSFFPNTNDLGIHKALQLGHALNVLNITRNVPTVTPGEIAGRQHIAFSLYCDLRNEGAQGLGQYVLFEAQPHKLPHSEEMITVNFENSKSQVRKAIYASRGGVLGDAMFAAGQRWEEIHNDDEKAALGCECLKCKQRYEETLRVEAKNEIPDELQLTSA
jgi:hypothetical protein